MLVAGCSRSGLLDDRFPGMGMMATLWRHCLVPTMLSSWDWTTPPSLQSRAGTGVSGSTKTKKSACTEGTCSFCPSDATTTTPPTKDDGIDGLVSTHRRYEAAARMGVFHDSLPLVFSNHQIHIAPQLPLWEMQISTFTLMAVSGCPELHKCNENGHQI